MTTDNELRGFEKGYVCAVATMLKPQGDTVTAAFALRALGPIDWRNIDSYDRQIFKDAGMKLKDFGIK